jgi:inner membrane protein
MLFKTHLVVGLFVFLALYRFSSEIFLFGLFFIFATVFVDIDSRKSRLGKIFIFRPIQLFLVHRGIIHSLFVLFGLSIVVFLVNKDAGSGFFFGYSTHILLDCFSSSGVSLFFPFSNSRVRGFIRTNGITEDIIFVVFLLADSYLVLKHVLYFLA